MSGISRRSCLKKASLGSGLAALGSTGIFSSLSAEEIRKLNPRAIDSPIRLGSNFIFFHSGRNLKELNKIV